MRVFGSGPDSRGGRRNAAGQDRPAFRFQTQREYGDGYVRLGAPAGPAPQPDTVQAPANDPINGSSNGYAGDGANGHGAAEPAPAPVPAPRPRPRSAVRRQASERAAAEAQEKPAAGSARLASLDAFRGFTVAGMLLVNNTAVNDALPPALAHAEWGDPITFTDLIFPWFLFVVGVAVPFSANGKRESGRPRWQRALLVLQRTAVLFGVGLLLDSSLQHAAVFQLGVLQLIALAYLVGRSVYRVPTVWRALLAAALLGAYGAALMLYHAPGHSAGEITAEHNLVRHLNDTVFGRYSLGGLPSVLPTSALVILGSVAGDILRAGTWSRWRRAGALAAFGAILLAAGWLWGHFLLMNKPVWSPPYIVYSAGWGALGLAALYVLADIWRGRALVFPLVVFGANALVAYAGAIFFKVYVLQTWTTHSPLTGKAVKLQQGALDACIQLAHDRVLGGWLYTAGYIGVWWLVCLLLYKRKIFVRA